MQYHHFQDYTIRLVVPIITFYIGSKEMHPIFVFAKCCWSVHSKVVRLGKHAPLCIANRKKTLPKQTLQFHIKFMYMSC